MNKLAFLNSAVKKRTNRRYACLAARRVGLSNQSGFTFLEMLISFAVLATSIVGVVGMQALAKKSSFDAQQRVLATALANDITERMRVNTQGVVDGFYSGTHSSFATDDNLNRCTSTATPCNGSQIAANDLYEWKMSLFGADVVNGESNIGGLISPVACISYALGEVSVVVTWNGRNKSTDAAESKADGSLAANCGTASDYRRIVYLDTFLF